MLKKTRGLCITGELLTLTAILMSCQAREECTVEERPCFCPGGADGVQTCSDGRFSVCMQCGIAPEVRHTDCGQWPDKTLTPDARAEALFPNGVASHDPHEDTITVWTYSSVNAQVRVRYTPGPDCDERITDPLFAGPASGGTVRFNLTNLQPGTRYRYRVQTEHEPSVLASGWFETAPAEDRAVRVFLAADISSEPKYDSLLSKLPGLDADLLVTLGDWPYTDLNRTATSLSQYRDRYRSARGVDPARWVTSSFPLSAIWDDHEIINDWDGFFTSSQPARLEAGMRVWREWFPVSGARENEIYRAAHLGPNVELFYLDCRSHRSANRQLDSPDKTMLGTEQLSWLLHALSSSNAAFKIVFSSVPLYLGTTDLDSWEGFVHERDRLLQHIQDNRIGGVVFVSADQHWLSIHHLPQGPKEFQIGPTAQFTREPVANPRWVPFQAATLNVGELSYAPAPSPRLTFTGWDENHQALYTETFLPGTGQIEVVTNSVNRSWELHGAHVFVGTGETHLTWATPGAYTAEWVCDDGQRKTSPPQILENAAQVTFADLCGD